MTPFQCDRPAGRVCRRSASLTAPPAPRLVEESPYRLAAVNGLRETVAMRRTRVVVAGRVQGVFFRASCAERARALGLAGWVRNDPDGRVEAVFEGPEEAVETMIRWCHEGPPHARVDAVEIVEETPEGEAGFRVR